MNDLPARFGLPDFPNGDMAVPAARMETLSSSTVVPAAAAPPMSKESLPDSVESEVNA
jgi:hypothetical protein